METNAANPTPEHAGQNANPSPSANSPPSPKPKRPKPTKKQKLRDRDIAHLKYFEQIAPLLEPLRDVGCQRDKANNRELHFDQYCLLILLFLFNPMVDSLRAIQRASELKKVQQRLGCPRTSLGSLSEATQVFDPELLKPIIAQLGEQTTQESLHPYATRR